MSDQELEGELLAVYRDGGGSRAKEPSAPSGHITSSLQSYLSCLCSPVVGVGGGGVEGAGGAVDHHVVLAAVISTDPGYGGAGPADLEAGHGVITSSPQPGLTWWWSRWSRRCCSIPAPV